MHPTAMWLPIAMLSFAAASGAATQPSSQPSCQPMPVESQPNCPPPALPTQRALNHVRTAQVTVPNNPFGLAYATQQKDVAFVSLPSITGSSNSTLGVLDVGSFTPRLLYRIPLPYAYIDSGGALGVALTHDGRHVLIAAGPGIIIVDAARAAAGRADAVVGTINGNTKTHKVGVDATEIIISPDDKYVFVSQEYGPSEDENSTTPGNVDVFKLDPPTANGSLAGSPVGSRSLGFAVVGMAFSPDARTLYATSEDNTLTTGIGSLSVLDVATLETHPAAALRANVSAGCNPVRALVSQDGKTVWVTARASNQLLAFDAAKLVAYPATALIASVQVGTAPVGLTFAKAESRILTADSNRFCAPNATTGLSVVDVQAALAGRPAVLGRIPTGLFPREFATSPDGKTILVSDYSSEQVQAVDVATIP